MAIDSINLDGGEWRIGKDPDNLGRERGWTAAAAPEALPVRVPGALQMVFPAYYGVVWYWRTFAAPAVSLPGGRLLLHFHQVDFHCEAWINGAAAGSHAGGEEPFYFDITDLVRPGAANRLSVRVINVANAPIDGWSLANTPVGAKTVPFTPGREWNYGGILDSVELRVVPAVYLTSLHLRPDWQSGAIRVDAEVVNTLDRPVGETLSLAVSPSPRGITADRRETAAVIPPGRHRLSGHLQVPRHRLWDVDDPHLYRVEARLGQDELADRCGFRDFRFTDGCFRLNGRRIFLRGAHTLGLLPDVIHPIADPVLQMRDIVNTKAMGFNCIRYICCVATRRLLDLCDETGLMVMGSSLATWLLNENQPDLAECYDRSLLGAIRRDRNHPCIILWYTLNETVKGPLFDHAVGVLGRLRQVDPTRLCLLNSGRFDLDCNIGTDSALRPGGRFNPHNGVGAGSNPGSETWDITDLDDRHIYLEAPHQPREIAILRGRDWPDLPLFLSEYGIGSAMDLVGLTRYFERRRAADRMDAVHYRGLLERFMADWRRWRLNEVFGRPEDYFRACLAANARQRSIGINAVRANPRTIGYSMTGLTDHGGSGEGPVTLDRRIKPGAQEALADAFAPLKWCLFVEPQSIYSGDTVAAEVILANEDQLPVGDYRIRVRIFDPDNRELLHETVGLTIPPGDGQPFALPVWRGELAVNGPAGFYRLTADFADGADATDSAAEFRVSDRAAMPPVTAPVELAGEEMSALGDRLNRLGIRSAGANDPQAVLLAAGGDPTLDCRAVFDALNRGRTAVVLTGKRPAPATLAPWVSRRWRLFGRFAKDAPEPAPALLRQIPESLELGGVTGERFEVEVDEEGCTGDLDELWDGKHPEVPVYLYATVDAPREGLYTLWLSGDWYYKAWLDGRPFIDRLAAGNGEITTCLNHSYTVFMAAGKHVLAIKLLSGACACLIRLRGPLYRGNPPPEPPRAALDRLHGQFHRLDWLEGLYIRNDWGRRHPVFAGLHDGGLLDWQIFRNLLPRNGFSLVPSESDGEVLAGGIMTASGYNSGIYLREEPVGPGRLITTCFDIVDHLGSDPAAERLLRNLLNYAAGR